MYNCTNIYIVEAVARTQAEHIHNPTSASLSPGLFWDTEGSFPLGGAVSPKYVFSLKLS